MAFGLQAKLTAQQGQREPLAELMKQAALLAKNSAGCLLYVVQLSLENEQDILISEVWLSQDAHTASLANPDILQLIVKARPLIAGMQGTPTTVISDL